MQWQKCELGTIAMGATNNHLSGEAASIYILGLGVCPSSVFCPVLSLAVALASC